MLRTNFPADPAGIIPSEAAQGPKARETGPFLCAVASDKFPARAFSAESSEFAVLIVRMVNRAKQSETRPRARPGGSIRGDELLRLAELKRRLGWGEHAVRQARKAGLRLIAFGREKYALGSDVLAFFGRLAEQQGNRNGRAD